MKKSTLTIILVVVALLATIGTAAASESRTVYRATLDGASEVPFPVQSDARGTAVLLFSDDGSALSYKLVVNGLDYVIGVHIHVAAAPGQNGPIVLRLELDLGHNVGGTFNGLLGSGTATSTDLTGNAGILSLADLRTAIEEGRAYVNVHTPNNPGGEIRGAIQ